jgi:hypothetical protein
MLDRSPKVHASDCIRYICLRQGHYVESEDGPNLEQMQLGSAIEWAVADRYRAHYPNRFLQLREIELDDIVCNPDLVDWPAWRVGEIKLTWASIRHGWDSQFYWKYWAQLMSYCQAIETRGSWLEVFYARGDHKKKMVAYKRWERDFTMYELGNNWSEMQRTRDVILEERLVNKTRGSYD